jgi:hypothetical protein
MAFEGEGRRAGSEELAERLDVLLQGGIEGIHLGVVVAETMDKVELHAGKTNLAIAAGFFASFQFFDRATHFDEINGEFHQGIRNFIEPVLALNYVIDDHGKATTRDERQ